MKRDESVVIFLSLDFLFISFCNNINSVKRLVFVFIVCTNAKSRLFQINLMKTGVGHSKYCNYAATRCLISPCSSLRTIVFVFILFDFNFSRSVLIQCWESQWSYTVFAVFSLTFENFIYWQFILKLNLTTPKVHYTEHLLLFTDFTAFLIQNLLYFFIVAFTEQTYPHLLYNGNSSSSWTRIACEIN